MDENPNQSNEEDLSARLARDEAGARGAQELPERADTAHLQQPVEPQGAVGGDNLHDGTANQMLLTGLQRSEDSGDRQNEASRKVILSGYKAFEKSVEQPSSRNETQLRKMHDGQQHVNERVFRLQGEQIGRMGDRLDRQQIRNWLTSTIPASVISRGILCMIPHCIH
ncbi:hypothetical protein [Bifidobacterium mellis]|nr:hypothetical protein [Bifidobacterium mellis]